MGGIAISTLLAVRLGCGFAFAEKKVTEVATKQSREESMMVIKRHDIPAGARVLIGEDVTNSRTTAIDLLLRIEAAGAVAVGTVCLINRAMGNEWKYLGRDTREHEVSPLHEISLLEIPTEQFKQNDPAVADYIEADRIVWNPKPEWDRLMAVMRAAA